MRRRERIMLRLHSRLTHRPRERQPVGRQRNDRAPACAGRAPICERPQSPSVRRLDRTLWPSRARRPSCREELAEGHQPVRLGAGRSRWQLRACRSAASGTAGVQESAGSAGGAARRLPAAARSSRRSHLHRRQVSAHACRAPQVGQRMSSRDWIGIGLDRRSVS